MFELPVLCKGYISAHNNHLCYLHARPDPDLVIAKVKSGLDPVPRLLANFKIQ